VLIVAFSLVSGMFFTFGTNGANGAVDGGAEAGFVARIAAERTAAGGLAGYSVADDLVAVARRHAARMASEGRLYHNPSLGSEVTGWTAVGENVGVGPSVDDIHRAFMASATHRHAILSGEYTQVGVGVEVGGDGTLWVVEVFRRPDVLAASPPPQDRAGAVRAASSRPSVRRAPAPVPAPVVPADAAVAPAAAVPPPPAPVADPAEPAVIAALAGAFDGTGFRQPPATSVLARRLRTAVADVHVGRSVTAPIGVAAGLLLLVVLGLLVEVGRERYPAVSVWRRQRNQASMSSSRSPSSTAWTLPVS
jgi:hypothetical protein